jgi:hypothetical protein
MIKRLEMLKNTVNKYMADLQPDRLTTYQSEWKLVVSRRPGVLWYTITASAWVDWAKPQKQQQHLYMLATWGYTQTWPTY